MQESEEAIYRCRRRLMVEPMDTDRKVVYFRGFASAYSDGVKALGSFWEDLGYKDSVSSSVELSLIEGDGQQHQSN